MKRIISFIFQIFSNAIAILAANHFISGFHFTGEFPKLIITATILTSINTFIRPVLKLILSPFIILTFGLFLIIINAISLYLLDFWSKEITIEGFTNLLLATLIISFVNFLVHLGAKFEHQK